MGVYVHIPFCARKCYYCDFYSIVVRGRLSLQTATDNYLSSLQKEALFYKRRWRGKSFSSLYVGGGTPTVLEGPQLADLILFLRHTLPFGPSSEITVEANPQSVSAKGLRLLARAGVNRISLGAQAFQDHLLQSMGRTHRALQIGQSIQLIRDSGIENINLDLIFGLPGQTAAHWQESLEAAIRLRPAHLSCYNLILEEGTPFYNWHRRGLLELPSEDEQAEMYTQARQILRGAGYEHYEISNFSKPGQRARHNLLYWRNQPFLGLGAAATGYLNGVRYTNVAHLQKYMAGWEKGLPPLAHREVVGQEQEMDETMMVGMRLLAGVNEAEFKKRYGRSFWDVYPEALRDLLARGLVIYEDGFLKVTEEGLYLQNQVSSAFLR